jgi:phage terminase Nu1 subunit (DNA packaging protein)
MSGQPLKVVANVLNLSERRVQQLAKENIIPKANNGRYDLMPTIKAYIMYLQDLNTGKKLGVEELSVQRVRLLKAQADKTEIEVDILEGNVIPADEVEEKWGRIITAFRARILSLPNKLAPLVTATNDYKEAEEIIKEYVYEALIELSEYDPEDYRHTESSKKGNKTKRTTAKAKS